MGTVLIIGIILVGIFFSARSLWKSHKEGKGGCSYCPSANGCPHSSQNQCSHK